MTIRVAIRTDADVVTARQEARAMGAELGFGSTDLTLLATAISEVARNITTYAGEGEVDAAGRAASAGRDGIEVVASDDGPGDRGRRAGDAGRLHDGQRPRPRAAGHAPARRRLRARDRAGRGHHDPAREVDAVPDRDEPGLARRARARDRRAARCPARRARATARCSSTFARRRARRRDRRARARRRGGRRRRRSPPTCWPSAATRSPSDLLEALPRRAAAARAAW